MAKKKINVPDSEIPAAGAAPARERRARTRHAAVPAASAPEISTQAPLLEHDVTSSDYTPEYEEVARLAYSYWEARGCEGGSPEEDWLRAEQELRARRSLRAGA